MQISVSVPEQSTTPTALTIGNFDGLHLGHRAMLDKLIAVARAHHLPACVLTFEPHPREFFTPDQAPARLTGMREKLALLQAAGVDHTFVLRFGRQLAAQTPQEFIDRVLVQGFGVQHLIIGDDFCFGRKRAGNLATLQAAGAAQGFTVDAMHTVEVDGIRVSSSAVREALFAGNLELAARLLGRTYNVAGRVIHGDKIGRKLGFPTANIQFRRKRIPLDGVFAVTVEGLQERPLQGAASIGVRPTLGYGLKPVLEVHLLDFSAEIYRQHVSVNFVHKLRDQKKYDSVDALKEQIARDVDDTRRYFAGLTRIAANATPEDKSA
ncbi:bifunctional riboflavin kinase and FAD synthetase [Georgfuchsia toluolica]|uniref:Riboflavin biosynthesis protein n=1 Tax=Georgfuchsia toluolica TaxID=424218 RepID=A0A916NA13_9PROT|nr:bifunctional riboflavin kinase/FAD synthetase [Georgfuchsia toluolica]CAG4885359.1 bifunctional riboflavin kinase and FAD synthetase [Georgfuchsia toluolica]